MIAKHLVALAIVGMCVTAPVRAEETIEQYCARVIADADKGKSQMFEAGLLYFHGKHMGKPCVKVDYVRSFELLLKAGALRDAQSLLKNLAAKADSGNPKAQAAIRELEKRGIIKKVNG